MPDPYRACLTKPGMIHVGARHAPPATRATLWERGSGMPDPYGACLTKLGMTHVGARHAPPATPATP